MARRIDVVGDRFGRLVVTANAAPAKNGRRRVRCKCDCGGVSITDPRLLLSGRTRSCGCLHRETVGAKSKSRQKFTTPANDMPENNIWQKMKQRCTNPNDKKYPVYGGRGIKVCKRWSESFGAFLADMGRRPSPAHSIDRVDVDGDYEPRNCRWATSRQQGLNRQYHRMVEFDGKALPLSEACRLAGVNYQSALYRLNKGADWKGIDTCHLSSE